MQGGAKFLQENILGIEVEVEFHSLYKNQPLFSDIDQFIRQFLGLNIQDLRKTYWKYKEGVNVGSSKGQLIYGDALYFKSPDDVISWCTTFSSIEATNKIFMACVMGIIYGYLDYSLCLLNHPQISDFLDQHMIDNWKSLIFSYGRALKYNKKGAGKLSSAFNMIYRLCQPTYKGYSLIGHHLGTRKKFGIFY